MRWTDGGVTVVLAATLVITACGSDGAGSEAGVSLGTAGAATVPVDDTLATTVPAESDGGASTTGSGVETTVAEEAFDACAALVAADLDVLLGEPAGLPEPETDQLARQCVVPALNSESRGKITFTASSNAASANYENSQTLFGVDTEIEGLGDAAFISGPSVVVLTDDTLINLGVVRWSKLGAGGVTREDLEDAVRAVLAAADLSTEPATGDDAAGAVDGVACSLLAEVDLEALVGEPLGESTSEEDGATNECEVPPVDPESTAYVSLTVIESVLGSEAVDQFAGAKDLFGVDSTVDGLGDEAFHSGPVLAVLSGERAFLLWVMGDIMLGANVDDADLEAAMVQVLAAAGE